MRMSNEDKNALINQNNQFDRQDKLARMASDEYYGNALNCDGDYRVSRRVRESGYDANGEYWEEQK